jgi:branched-chain amino acid aminotransferase
MEIAPYYWFDGALSPKNDITVHPFAHALHYGSGVFEGIRAYATPEGPAIFRLREHMERFLRSAEMYGLDVRWNVDELCEAVVETVRVNELDSAYIRPLAFFGENTISLAPRFHCPTHVLVALRALGGYFGAGQENGIRVTVSPWRKFPSTALPATAKCSGHYANSVLAMQEAVSRGFAEAILLNDRGDVAEGTGENVFLVKDGVVRTNDETADILLGVTRATVIEMARERGIPVHIGPISLGELLDADEAFFTGTAAEVTPIAQIDDRMYPTERPITAKLRAAYDEAIAGRDPRHPDWVTFVPKPVAAAT